MHLYPNDPKFTLGYLLRHSGLLSDSLVSDDVISVVLEERAVRNLTNTLSRNRGVSDLFGFEWLDSASNHEILYFMVYFFILITETASQDVIKYDNKYSEKLIDLISAILGAGYSEFKVLTDAVARDILRALSFLDIIFRVRNRADILVAWCADVTMETLGEYICTIQALSAYFIGSCIPQKNLDRYNGALLENYILFEIWMYLRKIAYTQLCYFRYKAEDNIVREIDAVIEYDDPDADLEYTLIEVKSGTKVQTSYEKNLLHESLSDLTIKRKIIVYRGENTSHNGIDYVEALYFVTHLEEFI